MQWITSLRWTVSKKSGTVSEWCSVENWEDFVFTSFTALSSQYQAKNVENPLLTKDETKSQYWMFVMGVDQVAAAFCLQSIFYI